MKSKSRNINLDLLRVLLAAAVMVTHTCAYVSNTNDYDSIEWCICTFIAEFNMFAVPCFFMLSGCFLLEKENLDYCSFLKKSIKRIVLPFLLWSFIYTIYTYKLWNISPSDLNADFIKNLLTSIIKGPPHLWFMSYLMSFYLFLPILKEIADNNQLFKHYLIIIIIFCFIVPYVKYIPILEPLSSMTFGISSYFGFSVYFLLGYKLRKYKSIASNSKMIMFFILSILLIPISTLIISQITNSKFLELENYLSPSILIASSCLFLLFYNLDINKKNLLVFFSNFHKYTFTWYLSHVLIINLLIFIGIYSNIHNQMEALLVHIILTFMISCLLSIMIYKMKTIIKNLKGSNIMLKRYSQTDIIYVLLSISGILLSFFFRDTSMFIQVFFYITFIHMILSMIYLKANDVNFFSISGLFVFFSYIFHFGQLFIKVVSPNYSFMNSDVIGTNGLNSYNALLFSLTTIFFVVIGIRICTRKKIKCFYQPLDHQCYLIMALLILLISFPIKLYIDINKIILFFKGGYYLAYSFKLNGILTQISSFYYVGFIILILVFKEKKKISNSLTLFLLFYQCITMLTGNRGIQLIRIVFTLIIYYKYVRHFSKYDLAFILIAALGGMKFISVMSAQRIAGFNNINDLLEVVLSYDNVAFLAILDEFGYTLQTLVIEFRNGVQHAFGLTYLYSLFGVFPNIGSFLNSINFQACYVNMLKYPQIGGSYIGELFYNFSYFGPLFGVVMGMVVEYISSRLNKYILNNHLLEASCLILPSISVLWWVRNYFKDMPREFVWGILLMVILYKLAKSIVNKYELNDDEDLKKVSIIMGVYNTEVSYLKESIDSILNQTYKNIELIIVDDCSNNVDTINYLQNIKKDNRIKLIKNESNMGLTKSLNIALRYCTGDYVARMDSDDICEIDRIEYQVDYLNKHSEIDILSGSAKLIGILNHKLKYSKNKEELKASLLFHNKYIIHPSVMIRKKSFGDELKYNENYPKAQDYALWCNTIMSKKIVVNDRIVINYRIHGSQASISSMSIQSDLADKIRRNYSRTLLTDENKINDLIDLSNGRIGNADTLERITDTIIENNKSKQIFNSKYLIEELSKIYTYQYTKILFGNSNKITTIQKIKHKSWFLRFKNIRNLIELLRMHYLLRK